MPVSIPLPPRKTPQSPMSPVSPTPNPFGGPIYIPPVVPSIPGGK